MGRWTAEYSFWTGVQIDPTLGVFLLGDDEMMEQRVPHTVVATLKEGDWSGMGLKWTASAVCWATKPRRELIVVGHEGEILAGPLGTLKEEESIEIDPPEGKSGHLRCARAIGGRAYIAGMDRQVYRRAAKGRWEAVDAGLPYEEEEVVSFEAIDGFSENEIYAVGRKGEIWRFDGKRWRQIDTPTNLILLGVHCAEDGVVYVCGQVGTLLRGRNDEWEIVKQKATQQDFWDVAWFKGSLYLATRDVLYVLRDGQMAPVDYGDDDIPFSFYRFSVSPAELWTIGSKDAMRFDGTTWSRLD